MLVGCGLMGCNTVWSCRWLSASEDLGDTFLQNTANHLHDHSQHVHWYKNLSSRIFIIGFQIFCTEWLKSHAGHDTRCICKKNKLHWNKKAKDNITLSVGDVHHNQRCMYSLFSSCFSCPFMFDPTWWRVPVSQKWFNKILVDYLA